MKELTLLTWLAQLGLSVVVPLAGWIFLALWLCREFGLGQWCVWVGIAFGLIGAIDGFVRSLKSLSSLAKQKEDPQPPVSFNDHD